MLSQLYESKKVEYNKTIAKNKLVEENNNDIDDKPVEKTIFIDRIIKLALEERIFTDENVLDELKTILLAVGIHFESNISYELYLIY